MLDLQPGSNLSLLGIINCTFELGKSAFTNDFIVCQNLTRPLILGRDFLMKNHVTVRHLENGKCILDYHQEELIATLDITSNPQLRTTTSVPLPGRTLVVIQINSNLEPEQSGQIYDVKPNIMLSKKYPNLYLVPMIHNVDTYVTENVPMVLINFLVDDISIAKGEIMGFLQNQSLDISEITTEILYRTLTYCDRGGQYNRGTTGTRRKEIYNICRYRCTLQSGITRCRCIRRTSKCF